MNDYYALVESLRDPVERYRAAALIAGGRGARASRGVRLSSEKIDALLWGLDHPNAAVRRGCLSILDHQPDASVIPYVARKLDDPVPRVRFHAVHALTCDVCKAEHRSLTPELEERIRRIASEDPSPKVRRAAQQGLERMGTQLE